MLTIAAVKAAGAQSRATKLFDGGGLFLFVTPAGTKSWRLKYRVKGREKLLVLGRFPAMSLQQARGAREAAKEQLGRGVDPGADTPVALSFEQLAREWHQHGRSAWSPVHADEVLASLERDVFPRIGKKAPGAIEPMECLAILQELEQRGCIASARRLRHRLSAIFRFGRPRGVANDPAEGLRESMRPLPLTKPMAALTSIKDCRDLLTAAEIAGARPVTVLASRFLALTAVRLEAVRGMRWEEVDLAARIWTVPAARMKLGRAKKGDSRFDHIVPLSDAAIEVLKRAALDINGCAYDDLHSSNANLHGLVFPGRGGAMPIAEGAIRELYQRAGFGGRHVPHGWRASFSTILNEDLGRDWRTDIDEALAHTTKGAVEGAYNRAQLLERRRTVFDRWGELLSS
ncbi:tyrosine-type recombinase/integrase [Qipengyuania sp.]|uniref:tyrosine-type recombinase/integrase n=1 Tax=Qipengyuania sp. TaxID=2004515 RepID=UPI0035C7CE0C